jgi:hypothetical protein
MKTSGQILAAISCFALIGLALAQDADPDELALEPSADVESEEQLETEDEFTEDESEIEAAVEPVLEDAIEPAVADAQSAEPGPASNQGMRFVLQVHPIFTPEQVESVYSPLINYLNASTPYHFELQSARDFHRYWAEIRRGVTPDLVLEDAHLAAYRIQRFGYTPLVKAEEPATFSLLTSGMNMDAELRDFVGTPVSSMPAPSLGYLVLTSWYTNPMQQPVIQSNASSWLDAVEIVFSMEAEAAIVPHNLVARYVNMEIVHTSEEFPHASITASPDVPLEVQQAIIQALTTLHEDPDYFSALHELDIEQFVPATVGEFNGLERWLEQIFTFR